MRRSKPRIYGGIAACAALVVLAGATTSTAATGDGGAPDPEAPQIVTRMDQAQPQLTLEQFQYMEELAERLEGTPGFGEATYDAEANVLSVSYVSTPPDEAVAVAASAPAGLSVEFTAANLSAQERKTALNAVLGADALQESTFGVYTSDDGVVVQVDTASDLGRSTKGSLEAQLESIVPGDVPVTVEQGKPEPASRLVHTGAWFGGVLYNMNPLGGECSTGFGARASVNGVVKSGVLTAHHCTDSVHSGFTIKHSASRDLGYKLYEASSGTYNGSPTFPDASFIETDGPSAGAVYIGGLTSSSALAIAGVAGNVNVGVPLCYSGVYSAGATCDHVVQANDFHWSAPGSKYGPQLYTVQAAGYTIGQGDSGGSVFAAVLDEQDNVVGVAAGIISGVNMAPGTINDCLGVVYAGRACSNHAMAQSFRSVYDQLPVAVIPWTGS